MEDEGIVDNAARIGDEVIGPCLREIARRHPSVGEVRGTGVFWAVELVADQRTREPLAPYGGTSAAMNATIAACKTGWAASLCELQPHPRGAAMHRQ